jgi:hypothetical protein
MVKPDCIKTVNLPAYWLVVLEYAVSRRDDDRVAEAQAQLQRLGIEASIRRLNQVPSPGSERVG